VDYGTNVTLTVPATDPQGFRFDGWQACTGARVSGRSLTVDSLTSSYTCRASYTALRRLTVTVASSGPGTAACSGSCTVYEGESVTITATRRDSASAFDGWACSDGRALGKTTPARVDNLQQNITCTANFSDIPLL
jgi:hypothetical protein